MAYEPAPAPEVATDAAGASDPALPAPYTCPITALRCDRHPFVALRGCGHVMAERALREAARDGTCPTCGARFSEEAGDVVPLLPDEEALERLRELLPGRRKQRRPKGKRKGRGGEAAEDAAAAAADVDGEAAATVDAEGEQQQRQQPGGT